MKISRIIRIYVHTYSMYVFVYTYVRILRIEIIGLQTSVRGKYDNNININITEVWGRQGWAVTIEVWDEMTQLLV